MNESWHHFPPSSISILFNLSLPPRFVLPLFCLVSAFLSSFVQRFVRSDHPVSALHVLRSLHPVAYLDCEFGVVFAGGDGGSVPVLGPGAGVCHGGHHLHPAARKGNKAKPTKNMQIIKTSRGVTTSVLPWGAFFCSEANAIRHVCLWG